MILLLILANLLSPLWCLTSLVSWPFGQQINQTFNVKTTKSPLCKPFARATYRRITLMILSYFCNAYKVFMAFHITVCRRYSSCVFRGCVLKYTRDMTHLAASFAIWYDAKSMLSRWALVFLPNTPPQIAIKMQYDRIYCQCDRKWQDVYIQCEYKSTKQKIKHLLREENKVKENKIS